MNGVDTYPALPPVDESLIIKFPFGESPKIVNANAISAIVLDGNLEGVSFVTSGHSNAEDVLATLREKYGKPSTYIPKKLQNQMGATYESFSAGWALETWKSSFLVLRKH